MFPVRLLILLVLLAGCAPPPVPEAKAPVPVDFPDAFYRQAAAQGEAVYAVDGEASPVRVRVYRGGPLAQLGHDHVISSRGLQGYVAPTLGRADLYLPLDSLGVDDGDLSPADAAATRRNMLDQVLEASRHPFALIHARCGPPCAVLAAEVTLHGVTRRMEIPVRWHAEDGRLTGEGAFRIRHQDFGLKPYAVLGGALRVEQAMDLGFRVAASRDALGGKHDAEAGAAVGDGVGPDAAAVAFHQGAADGQS